MAKVMYASRYGWIKDPWREQDKLLGAKPKGAIPTTANLSAYIPAVWNQGNQGSCTGHGIGGIITGKAIQLGLAPQAKTDPGVRFSPRWLYYLGRLAEGTVEEDAGANPGDIFDSIVTMGCAHELDWPYPVYPSDFDPKTAVPESNIVNAALAHLVPTSIRIVDGVDGICAALAAGNLVAIGAPWYTKWESTDAAGHLAKVNCLSSVAGGHETYLYGYDYTTKYLMGSNSWGTDWGNNGRYLMPFGAIDCFKKKGGYDAHIVQVTWSSF